jgi:glutamate formiminotransferase/formiminotetrahydrofolate cyclodeaminase
MNTAPIIECVPNFSEGVDLHVIRQITAEIESVDGVKLLDVDPGKATNRTVVTFVGHPEPVIEAAFLAIKKAGELIDMSKHKGEHPRMGATDVCPLIPIANISLEETAGYAHQLAERVGRELPIPIFMYEAAATHPERKNLAHVRSGEYEGLAEKLHKAEWKPDYGPAKFNPRTGATVIGARDFLVAYNVNLNTTSVKRANSVAFDVREQGRILREGHPSTGKILMDDQGEPLRQAGMCKSVKAIGWFIEEYGVAQVSMNLTNIQETPLHVAFDACCKSAESRGMRVTGSELVGLVPLSVLLDAGKYFLQKQERSTGVSDAELIKIAIKSLGLDELGTFDPQKKIIEYLLEDAAGNPLVRMDLKAFADLTASESPAPGGGSISAYAGALGAALTTMVANLSAGKTGWEDKYQYFSDFAERGQALKKSLLNLVDADTAAFNAIMEAFKLPKSTETEVKARKSAIKDATRVAIEIPYAVMEQAVQVFELADVMVREGNQNSLSDAAVGALCAKAAVKGAYLNVRINTKDFDDPQFVNEMLEKAQVISDKAEAEEARIIKFVLDQL